MYDDIAYDSENPRPGVIINSPHGADVYKGVPKVCFILEHVSRLWNVETEFPFPHELIFLRQDYVGDDVTVNNFLAVILGNRAALTGGSGKVVDSGPNDHIFIFYSDHGAPGTLGE